MIPNDRKFAVALLLGAVAIVLVFFLGERFQTSATILRGVLFWGGTAAYYFLCAFLLSRGDPQPLARPWTVLAALVAPFLILVLIALAVEPDKGAALFTALIWLLGLLSGAAGTASGRRAKRA